jgi:hypothetical protein
MLVVQTRSPYSCTVKCEGISVIRVCTESVLTSVVCEGSIT